MVATGGASKGPGGGTWALIFSPKKFSNIKNFKNKI